MPARATTHKPTQGGTAGAQPLAAIKATKIDNLAT